MVTQLRPGVYWLDLTGVNAYLVDSEGLGPSGSRAPSDDESAVKPGEGDLTLVDAGTPRDAAAIRAAIDETGHDVAALDRILVTHFDIDHVGSLASLGTDVPVYIGAADAPLLTGECAPPLSEMKGVLHRVVRRFVRAPGRVETVADGDRVGGFEVFETPGHTPGHVAYVNEAVSAAFVGDLAVERGGRLHASPWYLSYDTDDVRESIHDLADRAPAVEALCPGHGTPYLRDGSVRLAELGQRIEA